MKKLKRLLWILIPLILLAALWRFSSTRPVPVDVGRVTRGPIRAFVEEEGRTRVVDRYLVSAPVGGRLLRVDLEPGDTVEVGDLVAQVDPLPLESAVKEARARIQAIREQMEGVGTKKPKSGEIERAKVIERQVAEAVVAAEAELERIKATWARHQKDLVRIRKLAADRLVPVADLDAAVAAESASREQVRAQEVRLKIAGLAISATRLNRTVLEARLHDFDWEARAYEQQIAALEASLAKLADDLEHAVIKAPAGGVVLRLLKESEQVVAAGTPIMEIGDLSKLEIEVDFLSEDAAHMRKGMPVEIFGRALGKRVLEGSIDRIHPSAFEKISSLGVEQQRVYVIVGFDAANSGLRDLFRVEIRVILEEQADAVLVPEGALFRHRGAWHVFVVDGGRARLTRVKTDLRDGRARQVLEGLSPEQQVILHPGDSLEDGARVEVIE